VAEAAEGPDAVRNGLDWVSERVAVDEHGGLAVLLRVNVDHLFETFMCGHPCYRLCIRRARDNRSVHSHTANAGWGWLCALRHRHSNTHTVTHSVYCDRKTAPDCDCVCTQSHKNGSVSVCASHTASLSAPACACSHIGKVTGTQE
jgi:hypothetical protein